MVAMARWNASLGSPSTRKALLVAIPVVLLAVLALQHTSLRFQHHILRDAAAVTAECTAPQPHAMRYSCAVKAARGDVEASSFNKSEHFKSQFEEDRFILGGYFFDVHGGSFLEMGALDGVRYSNTYFFEKDLGWSGLLIEGTPHNYVGLRRNRPNSATVNAMVCDRPGVVHMIDGSPVGGVYEFMTPKFRNRWHPNIDISALPTIPCVPMQDLLDRFEVKHVDFFSLDVEGAEAAVVNTIDFTKFSASVILMEWEKTSSHAEALSRLEAAGYVQDQNDNLSRRNVVLLHPSFKRKVEELPVKT